MRRTNRSWRQACALGGALAVLTWSAGAIASGAAPPKAKPKAAAAAVTCAGNPAWISAPSLPDFGTDPASLCQFYQYAWQSFLWLNSPSGGPGSPLNLESYTPVSEVFQGTSLAATKAEGRLAVPGRKTRLFFRRDAKGPVVAKVTATGAVEFEEDTQAGPKGILVAQDKMITYYEQMVDPTFVSFVGACDFTFTTCQNAAWAQSVRMPTGSVELKLAWRPMSQYDPNVKSFFTITGAQIVNPDGSTSNPAFMALTGFHLVYTTVGHPEMIWATFEHIANSPTGVCTGPTKPPPGFKNWSYNLATATSCAGVNSWPSPAPTPAPKVPYYPVTQAFQNYAFGEGPFTNCIPKSQPENTATIQALNASMLSLLPKGSVWSNYFLSGALWTTGVLPPQSPLLSTGQPNASCNEVGSLTLANITMETFTQFPNPVPSPYPQPIQNCFTCHTNQAGTTTKGQFFVSHAFFNASNTGACPSPTSIPTACQQTQPTAVVKPAPTQ